MAGAGWSLAITICFYSTQRARETGPKDKNESTVLREHLAALGQNMPGRRTEKFAMSDFIPTGFTALSS
jgi:hypothetical protein